MTGPHPPPGKRAGKIMAIVAWLLVMALLSWYFAGTERNQYNPNQSVETYRTIEGTEVVLKRNRWGHYVASGEINGRPVTFMVDTGATHVAIPLHLGETLGLERGMAVPVNTANGRTTAYLTTIPHLSLGALEFDQVRGGLVPGMEGDQVLLGMSVLAGLSITQQGDRLILRR